jgi:hypothetical protein
MNNNVASLFVAKNTTLDIDLTKYARDNEGGTITVSASGSSNLPSGLSFANGKITGTTSATSGSLSVTLSDGTNNSNVYTLNITAIDATATTGEPTFVYGSDAMSSVNLTNSMTFFEPDEDDGIPYVGVITLNGTAGTYGEYKVNSTGTNLIAPNSLDIENFTLSNKSATSVDAAFIDGSSEQFKITSAKNVTSINGVTTAGLKEATIEFKTLVADDITKTTDWWESYYTIWNQTTNSSEPVTSLTALRDMFLSGNSGDVWISEDTRVTLAGTAGATSGTAIGMAWDGTYWTNQCQYDDGCKRYISTGQSVGTWNLDSSYLTVTVPNKAIRAFKVEDNKLMETDIRAAGSTETWKWYFGPDFNTFKSVYLQVENASN